MRCKDCLYEKHCRDKEKVKQPCAKFVSYSDSKKFDIYSHMMRTNSDVRID